MNNISKYSDKYNKKWYDRRMKDPKFRAKRVAQTQAYQMRKKREVVAEAIVFIGDIYNAGMDVDKAVDLVMAEYRISKRK